MDLLPGLTAGFLKMKETLNLWKSSGLQQVLRKTEEVMLSSNLKLSSIYRCSSCSNRYECGQCHSVSAVRDHALWEEKLWEERERERGQSSLTRQLNIRQQIMKTRMEIPQQQLFRVVFSSSPHLSNSSGTKSRSNVIPDILCINVAHMHQHATCQSRSDVTPNTCFIKKECSTVFSVSTLAVGCLPSAS